MSVYPRSRAARALIELARDVEARFPFARSREIAAFRSRHGKRGFCHWCGEPTEGRRQWHDDCLRWYAVAKGRVSDYQEIPLFVSVEEWEEHHRQLHDWRTANPRPEGEDYYVFWSKCPVRLAVCAECGGPFQATDHRLAVSVAHELRRLGQRGWWKAWAPSNLRPICNKCHARKTGDDRRTLNKLRARNAGQPEQMEIEL